MGKRLPVTTKWEACKCQTSAKQVPSICQAFALGALARRLQVVCKSLYRAVGPLPRKTRKAADQSKPKPKPKPKYSGYRIDLDGVKEVLQLVCRNILRGYICCFAMGERRGCSFSATLEAK